ncbi:Prolactin-8A8 [Apodemus speciosus]|uniref:Prolactin-8A8 n=1 Tax=Apodemus speciosus TaxID=105296 RepID=A0ABQ0FFN1_APOSI
MELPLSQTHFSGPLLLLVMSNLLLWEKVASIPACVGENDGCWNPLVETFSSTTQAAETLRKLSHEFYEELTLQPMTPDEVTFRAEYYCHTSLTNPPNRGYHFISMDIEEYLKILINYVGSWISPLFHLVIELNAMQDVPETILSKAKEIEENNRQILDDLRWILTKVYPTAKSKEKFASWGRLSFLKSKAKLYTCVWESEQQERNTGTVLIDGASIESILLLAGPLLLLVMSNLLLWEKVASIPACVGEKGGCWNPLVETFSSTTQTAEALRKLSHEFYEELTLQLIRPDEIVFRAESYCHTTVTKPPNKGIQYMSIEIEEYLKTLINYVGSWISPLFHLVIELNAMQDVPETILSKAKEIEEKNRQILDDLRWILTKCLSYCKDEGKFCQLGKSFIVKIK